MKHLILLSLFSTMTIMVSAQDVATAANFSENRTAMTEQANVPQNNTPASLRFGYLSYTSVLKLMPDYIAAQRNIDDLRTKYDVEMKRVENEFNQKYEQFLEGQHDFAPSILQKRQAELQELMEGETEWSISTKEQTERLNHLIGRLIRLARLEEQEDIKLAPQNISVIAEKVASDFAPLFTKEDKKFESLIEADIIEKVAQEEFYELLSILLDNARKYCDPAGTIRLTLKRKAYLLRKRTCITVSNDYKDGQPANIKRFFDRFYRAETSHNNQTTSGHGIGLSMAQHLVSLFRGKIFVTYKKQVITFTIWL